MRKITIALLVLGLSGCATQSVTRQADPQARDQSQQYLHEAIASFRAGKLSSVSEAVEKSIQLDPSNGLAYNLRALSRQRLGQFDDAAQDFQRAIELAPQDATIRNNFGTLLCTQKRFPAAEQNFLYAADITSNNEVEIAYTNAGLCAQRAGDGEKAWRYFEKAIQENPGQPTALYHLARLSLDADRSMDANTYLQQYREYAPHTAKSLFLAARIEHSLGNLNGVETYLSQMQSRFPNATELRQARQLIDPISKQLAPTPNYPGVVSYAPPPSLAATVVDNPAVAVSALNVPTIPTPTALPPMPTALPTLSAPEDSLATSTVTTPEAKAAPNEGLSAFVAPANPTPVSPPVAPKESVEKATEQAATVAASPFPERSGPVEVKNSDWVLQQDSAHYTLQIMASDDPSQLDAVIAADVAPDVLARIEFKRHDKVWHNLVLGSYAKNSDAQAALNALPRELKILRPWIRPFGSLKRVIQSSGS